MIIGIPNDKWRFCRSSLSFIAAVLSASMKFRIKLENMIMALSAAVHSGAKQLLQISGNSNPFYFYLFGDFAPKIGQNGQYFAKSDLRKSVL